MKNNRVNEKDLREGVISKAALAKNDEASHHAKNYASHVKDNIASHENPYHGVNETVIRKAHKHLQEKKLINHEYTPESDRPTGVCRKCSKTNVNLMRAFILGHTIK